MIQLLTDSKLKYKGEKKAWRRLTGPFRERQRETFLRSFWGAVLDQTRLFLQAKNKNKKTSETEESSRRPFCDPEERGGGLCVEVKCIHQKRKKIKAAMKPSTSRQTIRFYTNLQPQKIYYQIKSRDPGCSFLQWSYIIHSHTLLQHLSLWFLFGSV